MPPEDDLQRYAEGIALLKRFEGCPLKAYRDPVGVWTIGWGSTRRADGTPVKAGDKVTQAQADAMLVTELGGKVLPALRNIPHWEEMAPEQQGALISFAWNLGRDFYGHPDFATITRVLADREWTNVPVAMLLYRNPGTSVEEGLRRRREAEGILWSRGHLPASSEKSKPVLKPLFRITATQDTWLKKEPIQADKLADNAKVRCEKGRGYAVCAYQEQPTDAHARLELAAGAGTWWIFEPHWERMQASGEAMPAEVDWDDFNCLVTPHLTVGEVLQWDKRRTPGSGSSVRSRILKTAAEFERIREAWGQPLAVTSFYRPEPINSEVGGVQGSRHITGEAMDIYPTTRSLEEFYQWIRQRWTGGLGDGRNKGFIHLDIRGGGGFVPGAGVRPSAEWLY